MCASNIYLHVFCYNTKQRQMLQRKKKQQTLKLVIMCLDFSCSLKGFVSDTRRDDRMDQLVAISLSNSNNFIITYIISL